MSKRKAIAWAIVLALVLWGARSRASELSPELKTAQQQGELLELWVAARQRRRRRAGTWRVRVPQRVHRRFLCL